MYILIFLRWNKLVGSERGVTQCFQNKTRVACFILPRDEVRCIFGKDWLKIINGCVTYLKVNDNSIALIFWGYVFAFKPIKWLYKNGILKKKKVLWNCKMWLLVIVTFPKIYTNTLELSIFTTIYTLNSYPKTWRTSFLFLAEDISIM